MPRVVVEHVESLLLDLYRWAREESPADFQRHAMERLKPLLRFQSAIWGAGRLTYPGIAPARLHLHEVDPQAAVEWRQLNRHDKVIPVAAASLGRSNRFHAPSLFASKTERDMRDYAQRWRRQSYMVAGFVDPRPSWLGWVSLYRPNPDDLFSDAEHVLCERLMPHFEQARQVNQVCSLQRCLLHVEEAWGARAVADGDGSYLFAEPAFLQLLQREWRQADDLTLPGPLAAAANVSAELYMGRHIVLAISPAGGLRVLQGRRRTPLDDLSPRRRSAAILFARGFSHKQIAQRLGLSPATVRSHLAAAYLDLGVRSKPELMALAGPGSWA
jgi:DNA-binding CsgD family transcriptional regulator